MTSTNQKGTPFGYGEETPQDADTYREAMGQIENATREFTSRERKVQAWYITNYLPYWDGQIRVWEDSNGFSFGDIDTDILIKASQNDIRMLLKEFWDWFNGKATLTFRNWRPEFMDIRIESNEANSWEESYVKLKEYIWDYWLATHKKYWITKKLYWEKYFRYTDKNWAADNPEQEVPFKTNIPKKLLKNKPK